MDALLAEETEDGSCLCPSVDIELGLSGGRAFGGGFGVGASSSLPSLSGGGEGGKGFFNGLSPFVSSSASSSWFICPFNPLHQEIISSLNALRSCSCQLSRITEPSVCALNARCLVI